MGIVNSKLYENFTQDKTYPIIRAWYGNPKFVFKKLGVDVTNKIKNYIKNNIINISVNNNLFGDPAPGVKKILVVRYYNKDKKIVVVKKFERERLFINNLDKSNNTSFQIINVGSGGPVKNIRVNFDTSKYDISSVPYNRQNPNWSDKFKIRKINKNTISVIRIDKRSRWGQRLQLKATLIHQKPGQTLFIALKKNYKKNLDIYKTNNELLDMKNKLIEENKIKINNQKKKIELYRNQKQVKKRLTKYNLEETKTKNNIIYVSKIIILIILIIILCYLVFKRFS